MILKKYLYSPRNMFTGVISSSLTIVKSLIRRKYGFEKSITLNYPIEQYHYSDRLMGMPELVLNEKGKSLCTSCDLCVQICPTKCLELKGEVGKEPKLFSLSLSDCIFCGHYEVVCPDKAITMDNNHMLTGHKEEVLRLDFSEWKKLSSRQ